VEQPLPAPQKPVDLLSEVRAVALARTLVERDPDAALELLEKTRREHPTGYFVEERQALTVLALSRAGQQSAAREHAAAFLRGYPNGPFSDRVRAVERAP
jgi:outer membrane protein assembly factor BamD (BamD/ComL family)